MAASRGSVLATSLGAGGAGRCDGLTLRPKPILGGSGRRFGVAAGAVGAAGAAGGSSGAVRPDDTFTDASGRIATVISRGNGKDGPLRSGEQHFTANLNYKLGTAGKKRPFVCGHGCLSAFSSSARCQSRHRGVPRQSAGTMPPTRGATCVGGQHGCKDVASVLLATETLSACCI